MEVLAKVLAKVLALALRWGPTEALEYTSVRLIVVTLRTASWIKLAV